MQVIQKYILFGVLNWGLGHATRSIPIIELLQKRGHKICIASDGKALKLLKKSLHDVDFLELHSFEIQYAAKRKNFRKKIIAQLKHLQKKATKDLELTEVFIKERKVDLIISDNAFGVRSKKIKSIYITHQLNVLSGWTTFFTRFLHYQSMKLFDEIWVPDVKNQPNLSGKIGHLKNKGKLPLCYIGPLSRLKKTETNLDYKYAFILSGPEPQRGMLENKILNFAKNLKEPSILVRGSFEELNLTKGKNNQKLEIKDYCTSIELEKIINSSEIIVCRSGYTSLMDLLQLKKKAIYIPTPGQFEQEYLGKHIAEMGWGTVINQDNFDQLRTLEAHLPSSNFPAFNQNLLLKAFEANSI